MAASYDESLRTPIVWHPRDAAEAWQFKHITGPDSVFVAGGTLLRTQWETGVSCVPKHLIDLCSIHGIKGISISAQEVTIGAVTSLAVIRRDSFIAAHFQLLTEAVRSVAAPSVRNLATLGGNVMSLTGDALPALLVYDAELIWHDGQKTSVQPLSAWIEEMKAGTPETDRLLLQIRLPVETEDGECSVVPGGERILFPESPSCGSESDAVGTSVDRLKRDTGERPSVETKLDIDMVKFLGPERESVSAETGTMPADSPGAGKRIFGCYQKVGRREAFAPSVVTVAFLLNVDASGRIGMARIAAGGGQTIPERLSSAEAAVRGRKAGPGLLGHLHERIVNSFEPKGDIFASAEYRKQTAANVITAEMWRQLRML